jgi:serine/threonine protein kinase
MDTKCNFSNEFDAPEKIKQFKNFIKLCLTKDPAKRASVEQLMNHPFISCVDEKYKEEMVKLLKKK